MSSLLDQILGLDPRWILLIVTLVVFAEDAIFVGFVIPGETAAVLAGVGSGLGHVPVELSVLAVVLAAIAGDSVGYEVGRHFFGPKVLGMRLLAGQAHRIERAQDFLRRRGGIAVFLGRFTAFFRAMMPALAGASRMRYRTFLVWNAAGGVVWGTAFVLIGYLAGTSYQQVENQVGRGLAISLTAVVIVVFVGWRIRSKRAREAGPGQTPDPR